MKIKELKLLDVLIKKDDTTIFEGKVEDSPSELLNLEISNVKLDGKKVIIEI